MDDVESLAQRRLGGDKRDVGLGCTLGAGNDVDTVETESAEEFAGNAWCLLHLLAHDSHCGKVVFGCDRRYLAHLQLFLELFREHLDCTFGVGILDTDGRRVLGRSL